MHPHLQEASSRQALVQRQELGQLGPGLLSFASASPQARGWRGDPAGAFLLLPSALLRVLLRAVRDHSCVLDVQVSAEPMGRLQLIQDLLCWGTPKAAILNLQSNAEQNLNWHGQKGGGRGEGVGPELASYLQHVSQDGLTAEQDLGVKGAQVVAQSLSGNRHP